MNKLSNILLSTVVVIFQVHSRTFTVNQCFSQTGIREKLLNVKRVNFSNRL